MMIPVPVTAVEIYANHIRNHIDLCITARHNHQFRILNGKRLRRSRIALRNIFFSWQLLPRLYSHIDECRSLCHVNRLLRST
jgi:hypothetical protein